MTTPSEHSKTPAPEPKPGGHHGHDEGAVSHDPSSPQPEDSSVDLGHPVGTGDPHNLAPAGSTSGVSVVDWAALVEDAAPQAAEPASFDAASDVDLLFPGVAPAEATHHASPQELAHAAIEPTLHATAQELAHAQVEETMQAPAEALVHGAEATMQASPQDLAHAASEPTLQATAEELAQAAEGAFVVEETDEYTLVPGQQAPKEWHLPEDAPSASGSDVESSSSIDVVSVEGMPLATGGVESGSDVTAIDVSALDEAVASRSGTHLGAVPETLETPSLPPDAELDLAAEVAFAAPDEVIEDAAFTPETMFAEADAGRSSGKLPAAPKMELDSGRKLQDVVELGADAVVEDEVIVAEVSAAADSGVIAEAADVVDVADADEFVTEMEMSAVVGGSEVNLAEIVAEVADSDVAVEAEADEGTSGRDLIAEAVESGVDGTLQMPGLDVVDAEVISPDSGKKQPAKPQIESTHEIEIPVPPQPDPDDFFSPTDAAVVGADGEVVLGGAVEEATFADSSSIDLGSMPDLPPLPSASHGGSGAADIDLAALEKSASSSQRGAGKASAAGEIDLGGPSSSVGGVEESPVVVDSDAVDYGEVVETDPTADLDASADAAVVDDDAVIADGAEIEAAKTPPPKGKKTPKEVPAKGRGGAWIGGTLVGTLAGAGACVGLWLFGVEPPKNWRKAVGGEKTPQTQVGPNPQVQQGEKPSAEDLLTRGDFKRAKEAAEALPDDKKQLLLGQIAFREYAEATAQAAGNDNPKLTLEGAKPAIEKLEQVKTPDAYFQLGQIFELADDKAKAEKSYTDGLALCKSDAEKRRFKAALERVKLPKVAALPRAVRELDLQLALLTLLVFAPDDAAAGSDEAGYAFLRAITALNEKKFDEALKELEIARKDHKKGRLLRMGKQQNPDSDPTEEIFLRCADELKAYWSLQQKYKSADVEKAIADAASKDVGGKAIVQKLVDAKIIEKPEDAVAGIDTLLAGRKTIADLVKKVGVNKAGDLDKGIDKLAADGKKLADVAKKLGAEKPEDLDKSVDTLLAERKAVEDVGKKLVDAKIVEKPADLGVGVDKLLADKKTDGAKITGLETKLTAAQDDLSNAKKGFVTLEGLLVDTGDWKKGDVFTKELLTMKLKNLIARAKTNDPKTMLADLQNANAALTMKFADQKKEFDEKLAKSAEGQKTEIAKLNTQHGAVVAALNADLKLRRTSAEMLPLWLTLLEDRANKEFMQAALADAERVRAMESKDNAARANAIEGLVLRNQGQYAAAAAKLKDAEKSLPKDSLWGAVVAEALTEVADPVGYYGKKASDLADHNYPERAIQSLDRMLPAATPEQKSRLLAQRSLLKLELAMAGGRAVDMSDELIKQALADAKGAGDTAAAHYALGRIREEMKDMDMALVEFTKAVDLHKADDADGARYKTAKARALLAPRTRRAAEAPAPEDKKLGKLDADEDSDTPALTAEDERRLALVLVTVLLQPAADEAAFASEAAAPEGPAGNVPSSSDQKTAEQLADKVLADPNAPWDAKAQALTIKGRYTEALRVYVEGLQKNRLLRADQAAALTKIINQNPRLTPKTNAGSNPLEAETDYGNGLRNYYSGRFAEAEKHFQAAVDAVDGDDENARYYYFLGLAQLGQGKNRQATQNFIDGAVLERRGLPSRIAVNASLERIQGKVRHILDEERFRLPTSP